ncbi:glycosyltransferase family 2 protein [Thermodesulfobacteriota bacterium]
MRFSVIVPVYNANKTLSKLLASIGNQSHQDFELIIVDDCSTDGSPEIAQAYGCKLIRLPQNHGPAYCRNIGAQNAKGNLLAFTDSDCEVAPDWLQNIQAHFSENEIEAVMGKLVLPSSTLLGDSISALGFPAGGAIGFDKIWRVDTNGFTDSLSTCNCAISKDIFINLGGFDESFPYPGGEDSLLAYNLKKYNYRIKYCCDVLVYHQARDSLLDFLKWQFQRGICSYIFSKKVSSKKGFFVLRIWSTGNIIKSYYNDKKFPIVLFLLCISFFIQSIGFLFAQYNKQRPLKNAQLR